MKIERVNFGTLLDGGAYYLFYDLYNERVIIFNVL